MKINQHRFTNKAKETWRNHYKTVQTPNKMESQWKQTADCKTIIAERQRTVPTPPCIRLTRGKFELTNQDSAGWKKSSVLTSSKQVRKGLEIRQLFSLEMALRIHIFKHHTSLQKVKHMNHFVFLSFYFGAKNGSPARHGNLLVVRRASPGGIIVVLL